MSERIRAAVRADPRALTRPEIKEWCGRRWRRLFVTAAAGDLAAVAAASERIGVPGTDISIRTRRDSRPDRRRVAERFLKYPAEEDWAEAAPAPPERLDGVTLVFCPGLINSMLPVRGFALAFPVLNALGARVIAADAHPMRSCEANVADLVAAVERGEGYGPGYARVGPGESEPAEVILVGYSKGAADALAMLVRRPDLAKRVRALYCWGGAVGGSYLADDIYDAIKDVEVPLGALTEPLRAAVRALFPLVRLDGIAERLDESDVKGALRDLTTAERARFLDEHADEIDALNVPIFNVTAATTTLEVPYFQAQGYLQIRNRPDGGDPDNDMQLTQAQARMTTPMATDLAMLRAHHWDISYDAFPLHLRMGSANLDHRFPRAAALMAICQLTLELGL